MSVCVLSVCNRRERNRKMEESQEILLSSLTTVGVPIPPEVLSVGDLSPEALVSVCAHSLRIISKSESFPTTLPESMADRFKFCTDLASSVKNLGYIGDISFHKFLYPSEEDMYKLIRFLVGRLSESSRTAVSPDSKYTSNADAMVIIEDVGNSFKDATGDEGLDLHTKVEGLRLKTEEDMSVIVGVNKGGNVETDNVGLTGVENGVDLNQRNYVGGTGGDMSQDGGQHELEQAPVSVSENLSQMRDETKNKDKSLDLQQLEEQHNLLKLSVEMACDEHNPLDLYISQLNEQIDAKRHNLARNKLKWKAVIMPLEEKKRNLEEALCAKQPESQEKHQKWKKLEHDLESLLSETKQREEELSNLSTEIEKLPKLATRRSYIERVKEITKNSRKQDIDIERILKETRELQLESNMIQERLHRTYAVVDETLMREAKKDQVGEQAHILLTTIHESFEEISEKILATDRARREAMDLETKLTSIDARSLNVDKLQADLDAIRKENEYLQSRLGNP